MNLMALQVAENMRKLEMTVLFRQGGTWSREEVSNITNGLMTQVSSHPQHPEYLVLFKHFTKAKALEAHGGGLAFTATQVTGVQNKDLPFVPGFATNP